MTIRRNAFLPTVLLAMLTASCGLFGGGTTSSLDEARDYLAEGYLLQAYQVVESARNAQMAAGGAVDPDVQATYESLRYRMLIHDAREAIYADDEVHGRELASDALAVRPNDEAALALYQRAN